MRKMNDPNMPIGALKSVKDFLPAPSQLVVSEETTKVTITLSKSSIKFFKRQALQYHTKYQRMIRNLLDTYATQFSK